MPDISCSGALLYSLETKRFLMLHRTKTKQNNVWGLVGGKGKTSETPWLTLKREINEELGFDPEIIKSIPLESFVSNDERFNFHTYLCVVKKEFIPQLNDEHDGYAWVSFGKWPKPLHQGLRNTLQSKQNITKLQTVFDLIQILEKDE